VWQVSVPLPKIPAFKNLKRGRKIKLNTVDKLITLMPSLN
jgi:hypothetical protein